MVSRLIAALLLIAASTAPALAQCLSQGEAQQVVASGRAAPLGAVMGAVRGEVVKAQLCLEGGRYVYRLSVLANGQVTTQVVDASR
ncbi:PepSY domain-containing protein [Polymorphum gilvum]|uniref:PepSY domain-containing protein n=1 Tax=Polymorphum gilvum (strain LMG 25793 / CGMCC 1.9160 / SL003B-26A1) TaxID=991905 RepID=F2J6G3_POLGS|nr:hypothetical protein [Polymorphum gilvum]ADZ71337.1 hypothetical protein SL003B_2914 [Polymorphum gilvum SL003B-26A1]